MLKVRVVNKFSGRWGQVGLTSKHEWRSSGFWVKVDFGGQIALMARMNVDLA